jgi:hypothetical protein
MPGRSGDRGRVRDELLAEIVSRQPFLAILHAVTAFLFASALTDAAPAFLLALWLGYMGLAQAVRLFLWYRHVLGRLSISAAVWLVATSGAAGIGWGSIGVLFADLGSPAQQMLIPFSSPAWPRGEWPISPAIPRCSTPFSCPRSCPTQRISH